MTKERPAADGPGVAILLSTFNGEQYLAEQLASFTAQTHANWQLYWRDDGSSDGTDRQVDIFAASEGAGRCINHPEGGHMRATGSFLALLRLALTGPARFFAFSDQDDVWLPEKLSHGVAALTDLPQGRPGLYFLCTSPGRCRACSRRPGACPAPTRRVSRRAHAKLAPVAAWC